MDLIERYFKITNNFIIFSNYNCSYSEDDSYKHLALR